MTGILSSQNFQNQKLTSKMVSLLGLFLLQFSLIGYNGSQWIKWIQSLEYEQVPSDHFLWFWWYFRFFFLCFHQRAARGLWFEQLKLVVGVLIGEVAIWGEGANCWGGGYCCCSQPLLNVISGLRSPMVKHHSAFLASLFFLPYRSSESNLINKNSSIREAISQHQTKRSKRCSLSHFKNKTNKKTGGWLLPHWRQQHFCKLQQSKCRSCWNFYQGNHPLWCLDQTTCLPGQPGEQEKWQILALLRKLLVELNKSRSGTPLRQQNQQWRDWLTWWLWDSPNKPNTCWEVQEYNEGGNRN